MLAKLIHALVRVLIPAVYRYRAVGVDRVPTVGPALIVANHVSFVDSLVLGAALARVPRFVMHAAWLGKLPWLRPIFRSGGVIPIAGRHEDPETFKRAFESIDQALARGELVVIFPEGRLTPDGGVGPFKKGVEHVLARRPVPVVPVALRGLWGSTWSLAARRSGRARALRRRRVDVVAGALLEPQTEAAVMRRQVARLAQGL